MKATFADRLHAGPDYAPFGISWLKGLTARRIGLVILVTLLFCAESMAELVQSSFGDWASRTSARFLATAVAAIPFLVLVTITDNLSAKLPGWRRVAAFGIAVIFGAVLSMLVYVYLRHMYLGARDLPMATLAWGGVSMPLWVNVWFQHLYLGGLLTGIYYFLTRERAATEAQHAVRLAQLSLDRQMTEAQLQVLQAQIEPHFLFNTLANIKRLYLVEPAKGKQMIRNLSDYLRIALPQMREPGSTLRRELALARAYLNVLQVRMGARLKVDVAIADDLLEASLPPMMLSTLVENAIKHGINPLPQGGRVKIDAERGATKLKIRVADNGAGFHQTSGSGVGLANTRARLATLYGDAARLTLGANPGGGVIACIELPFAVAPANAHPQ